MDDSRDQRLAELERENSDLKAENAELRRRLEQQEQQLQKILQRGKRSGKNAKGSQHRKKIDRRRKEHRKHPGSFRSDPPPDTIFIEHEVHPSCCTHCGSRDLNPTGEYEDHVVADIPEPKIEWHRYRRFLHCCSNCRKTSQGRGDLELPGSHIGPRARLLCAYSRVHLGISLGKTQDLLRDYFGLSVSRAGLLGHLRWGGRLFTPVVDKLFELLRQSPVIGGDETGWRINGLPAWVWCFRDPRLALFLIDRHRNRDVLTRTLGESFAGTLVSDFYAAYNRLECRKQRCLVHLLRELIKLRDELPRPSVRAFIQPLIVLFQDALQLGKDRKRFDAETFASEHQKILDRFDALMLETRTQHPQCLRIWKRLFKHSNELFTFLDDPLVPPDNNGTERDIRSLAAARSDGGTHRVGWSAEAFARLKSVVATARKNGIRFIEYGLDVVKAKLKDFELPLPLTDNTT